MTEGKQKQSIYSVSELNRLVARLLEYELPMIQVEGEISNLTRAASGHWYFTLKDEQAQVSAAMFRGRNRLVRFRPENGMQVVVRAKAGLYAPRGNFQLVVESMQEAGAGNLQMLFEQLKQKLEKEGLFLQEHKKALPSIPKRIVVVTSPDGAAIRDILHVLQRRCPATEVLLVPAVVQGNEAVASLVRAIKLADNQGADLLIAGRGGGSLEDLWAFNEEKVARALFACSTPVISAVGHETDFVISDFVADARAPTPSAAAEMASPDSDELLRQVASCHRRLGKYMENLLGSLGKELYWLHTRLKRPDHRLREYAQQFDHLESRLAASVTSALRNSNQALQLQQQRLAWQDPSGNIREYQAQTRRNLHRLGELAAGKLEQEKKAWQQSSHRLHIASPLATLDRGYSIMRKDNGNILRSFSEVNPGDRLHAYLAEGEVECEVTNTSEKGLE